MLAHAGNDFNLNSRRISTKDGLLSNTVNELVQDEEGYIWMATNNGLNRYDGYSTIGYSSLSYHAGQHLGARIGRITYDPSGLLWIHSATYVNACYDLHAGQFVDWTGIDDSSRQFNKFLLSSSQGMFFYGYSFGVRRSQYKEGQFLLTDYTQQKGDLPSNNVLMILEDAQGNIWIPTDRGISKLPVNASMQLVIPEKTIISGCSDEKNVYFLTSEGEAYIIDAKGKQRIFKMPSSMNCLQKVNTSFVWKNRWMLFTPEGTFSVGIEKGDWRKETGQGHVVDGLNQGTCPGYHFIANRSGKLWIYPDAGEMRVLDLLPNAVITVNRGRKFHIVDDAAGRLFIATYGNGLFVWNPKTEVLRHFTAEHQSAFLLTNYLLYAIRDHQGCIWLGSEATGAYCLSIMDHSGYQTASLMNFVLPEPEHLGDWANAVSCVAERNEHSVTIGTRVGGIYEYDRPTGSIRQTGQKQSSIYAVFTDRQGHEWIGTNGEGVFIDGQQYNTKDSVHYLPENKIHDFCQDGRGRIWIASRDGGLLLTSLPDDLSAQPLVFQQFLNKNINERRIKDLELTPDGMLWIGTNDGIVSVDAKRECIEEEHFRRYNTSNHQFPFDEIQALHYADSALWVGGASSGMVKCTFNAEGEILQLQRFTTEQGLGSNKVASIAQDDHGYIWAATEEGISRINTRNNIVNSYLPSPVLQGNVANSVCRTRDGQLFFGTEYGFVTVSPSGKSAGREHLNARITDVHINGRSVMEEDGDWRQEAVLSLAHHQNTLEFFFSNFNYDNTQPSLYQFYLEGYEKQWRPMTRVNHANYAKLEPAHYVLHLRSLGSNNEWMEETTFAVQIHAPWYDTWWAWTIYLLALAFFATYVYRNWKEKFDLHQQMKLERQLSDFRMQLFTNITHEFRTPLAIIKGAIDKLDNHQAPVKTAQRGVYRMQKLVSQFMEFRKVRTGNLRLQVSEDDIVSFVRNIYQDFWPMAQQKAQQLTFQPSVKSFSVAFDHQIVETILYNLLSNAIKYTPEKGDISISLCIMDDRLLLACADSGPGISAERQKAMFKPFMQGLASQGGMGIGLYTAYEMAKVHHGSLGYEQSEKLGGSCFELMLPATAEDYQAEEYGSETTAPATQEHEEINQMVQEVQPDALNDLHIALIEDDADMMEQLRSELGVYFHIDSYMTGQAGIEGILQQVPALLVCDVMLPDISGYDIVERLRMEQSTLSMPIIMLTALDDESHQLKAYKAGADDYMVKPCNFRLLMAKAMQMMKWKNIQAQEARADATSTAEQVLPHGEPLLTTQADKVFLAKLEMLTARHMGETDFTVDRLAEMMTMGRTKFYGKVKELTALSPNKYLMQQRMQKAADLLADGELNVSEVSYRVGIQDPSYFNRCFKSQFGVPPSKYVKVSKE